MKNIMLDLETMGTGSTAAIIAIGAVEFDADFGVTETFYRSIDLQSSINKGLIVDGDTIMWWLKQSEKARLSLFKDVVTLTDGLVAFKEWFPKGNVQVWGNGADFDNVILANAVKAHTKQTIWPHYMNRCFRTLRSSFKEVTIDTQGTAHNALDDATWQADYLVKLVEKNKLKGVL